jgi:hypothetical protein
MAPIKTPFSRIFVTRFGSSPSRVPQFLDFAIPLAPEQNFGEVTSIFAPDPSRYDSFVEVGETVGAEERPTIGMRMLYTFDKSLLLELAKRRCPFDVQIHFGQCKDPRNFNQGWEKILAFDAGRISTWNTDDLGAMTPGDNNPVNQEVDVSGSLMYEIMPLKVSEKAASSVVQEIIDIVVCDTAGCGGDCGEVSTGCDRVFALAAPAGSSPGMLASVIYTRDGYTTPGTSVITTLAIGEDPTGVACVGDYLVVAQPTSLALHYAAIADILNGDAVWAEVQGDIVSTKGPRAIDSYSPSDTLVVGAGGYIYKLEGSIEDGVTLKNAGGTTTEDLNSVYMFSTQEAVAVGDANAVVYSLDGGENWSSVTGPEVGADLLTVTMKTKSTWLVGTSTGKLWYTEDSGQNWTEKGFRSSGTGSVRKVAYASNQVAYMAHATTAGGARGHLLRSIDGGNSWYRLPEGTSQTFPLVDRINSFALCEKEVNSLYAAGLADNAADGVILKLS